MSSYRELCKDLLSLDSVLSATVLRMDGAILYSDHKGQFEPLLSRSDAEAAVFRAAIRMGTRKEFMDKLGGIKYAFTAYGKVNQYTIPLDSEVKTLLFISEGISNHHSGNLEGQLDASPGILRIFDILKKHGIR